jgi:hypothetical protein
MARALRVCMTVNRFVSCGLELASVLIGVPTHVVAGVAFGPSVNVTPADVFPGNDGRSKLE